MNTEIQAWLKEILHPLPLQIDFLNRILKSAQDAATHAFRAGTMIKFEHIHLLIFVTQDHASNEKTWGFFRIEKMGTPTAETKKYDHSIEFYLYREG